MPFSDDPYRYIGVTLLPDGKYTAIYDSHFIGTFESAELAARAYDAHIDKLRKVIMTNSKLSQLDMSKKLSRLLYNFYPACYIADEAGNASIDLPGLLEGIRVNRNNWVVTLSNEEAKHLKTSLHYGSHQEYKHALRLLIDALNKVQALAPSSNRAARIRQAEYYMLWANFNGNPTPTRYIGVYKIAEHSYMAKLCFQNKEYVIGNNYPTGESAALAYDEEIDKLRIDIVRDPYLAPQIKAQQLIDCLYNFYPPQYIPNGTGSASIDVSACLFGIIHSKTAWLVRTSSNGHDTFRGSSYAQAIEALLNELKTQKETTNDAIYYIRLTARIRQAEYYLLWAKSFQQQNSTTTDLQQTHVTKPIATTTQTSNDDFDELHSLHFNKDIMEKLDSLIDYELDQQTVVERGSIDSQAQVSQENTPSLIFTSATLSHNTVLATDISQQHSDIPVLIASTNILDFDELNDLSGHFGNYDHPNEVNLSESSSSRLNRQHAFSQSSVPADANQYGSFSRTQLSQLLKSITIEKRSGLFKVSISYNKKKFPIRTMLDLTEAIKYLCETLELIIEAIRNSNEPFFKIGDSLQELEIRRMNLIRLVKEIDDKTILEAVEEFVINKIKGDVDHVKAIRNTTKQNIDLGFSQTETQQNRNTYGSFSENQLDKLLKGIVVHKRTGGFKVYVARIQSYTLYTPDLIKAITHLYEQLQTVINVANESTKEHKHFTKRTPAIESRRAALLKLANELNDSDLLKQVEDFVKNKKSRSGLNLNATQIESPITDSYIEENTEDTDSDTVASTASIISRAPTPLIFSSSKRSLKRKNDSDLHHESLVGLQSSTITPRIAQASNNKIIVLTQEPSVEVEHNIGSSNITDLTQTSLISSASTNPCVLVDGADEPNIYQVPSPTSSTPNNIITTPSGTLRKMSAIHNTHSLLIMPIPDSSTVPNYTREQLDILLKNFHYGKNHKAERFEVKFKHNSQIVYRVSKASFAAAFSELITGLNTVLAIPNISKEIAEHETIRCNLLKSLLTAFNANPALMEYVKRYMKTTSKPTLPIITAQNLSDHISSADDFNEVFPTTTTTTTTNCAINLTLPGAATAPNETISSQRLKHKPMG